MQAPGSNVMGGRQAALVQIARRLHSKGCLGAHGIQA